MLLEKIEEAGFVHHKSKRSKKRSRSRSSSRNEKTEPKYAKTEYKHKAEQKPSSSSRNNKHELVPHGDSIPGLGGDSSQDDSIICIDD